MEVVPRMPDSPRIPCSFCLKQENAQEIVNIVSWCVNIPELPLLTGEKVGKAFLLLFRSSRLQITVKKTAVKCNILLTLR